MILKKSHTVNFDQLLNCIYQVNCGWALDRTRRQWVDLGIHTEACMTDPRTCGAAGGAVSV